MRLVCPHTIFLHTDHRIESEQAAAAKALAYPIGWKRVGDVGVNDRRITIIANTFDDLIQDFSDVRWRGCVCVPGSQAWKLCK